jgi:bacterioferritin-associated ferredoxin
MDDVKRDEGTERRISDDKYICRCEEVTEREIREAVRAGARTVVEVKRWTRAGMGICQGRSCRRLVERIIAEELHLKPEEIEISSFRQPVRPVSFQSMDE